jgi:hypothetical protein
VALGFGIAGIGIGMVFFGKPPVSFLDLAIGGCPFYTQHFKIIDHSLIKNEELRMKSRGTSFLIGNSKFFILHFRDSLSLMIRALVWLSSWPLQSGAGKSVETTALETG